MLSRFSNSSALSAEGVSSFQAFAGLPHLGRTNPCPRNDIRAPRARTFDNAGATSSSTISARLHLSNARVYFQKYACSRKCALGHHWQDATSVLQGPPRPSDSEL